MTPGKEARPVRVCGLAGCGRAAVARVRLVWLRVLPPSGVSAKEKDLCSPCYLDKVREFDDGAGEVVLLA